jgi:hypothetical protein
MTVDTNYRAGIKLHLKNEWSSFAATFMRYEYALKMSGFLKYDKLGATAEAGWASFAVELGDDVLTQCRAMPELAILFVSPPALLKVDKDSKVSWKKARSVGSLADFFAVIKDVYTNLFHGETTVQRNGDLINAAQIALDVIWQAAQGKEGSLKLLRFAKHFPYQQ